MSDLIIQHCPLETEDIPEGWELVSLSNFVDGIQTGFASGQHNRDGEGVPHLRPMNISPRGTIDMEDLRYVAPDKNPLRLKRGDVLFNNTNSPAWVGKTAYIGTDEELAFSNHMTRLRAPGDVDPQYLAHQLQFLCTSGYFQHQCKKHVNQASINRSFLGESTPFLLPPTAEQRRIVGKIEALQERSRNAREAFAEVGPLLEQFRQILLASAFRGDLTADWRAANPNVEPATELLTRIRQERRQKWEQAELAKYEAKGKQPPNGWQDKYQEREPVDDSELPDLPDGWCWSDLEFVMDAQRPFCYGVVQPGIDDPTGVFLIRAGDLEEGTVNVDGLRRIPVDVHSNYSRSQVDSGEILVTVVGANVGVSAVVPESCKGFNIARALAKVPITEFHTHYVRLWMTDAFAFNWMKMQAREVARPTLNLEQLKRLPVPIPPIQEQSEIVTRIEAMIDSMNRMSCEASESESDLSQLDQSILAKAFRGELVPQDPNDEPASVLLERIRETREAQVTKNKSTKKTKQPPRRTRKTSAMAKSRFDDDVQGQPYLAKLMSESKDKGPHTAEQLYQLAKLPLADFYKQLDFEVSQKLIAERDGKLEAADAT